MDRGWSNTTQNQLQYGNSIREYSMLQHTFCHINGIGPKTESRLWQAGVTTWENWRDFPGIPISKKSRMEIPGIFAQSTEALEKRDALFFSQRLAGNAQWRLFSSFRNSTAYIDIETTGLHGEAEITTIALYDGRQIFTYVNGQNLEQFVDDIMRYDVLVSYNGKGFDVPFIEHALNISLPQAHIDLRFVLAGMGIKGGLKQCEQQMGITRGALDGVDGSFAVTLWRHYHRHNDEKALETLLAYNIEDTVNLERLLVEAWNRNVEATPFAGDLLLALPEPPQITYQPDLDCIARLQKNAFPKFHH